MLQLESDWTLYAVAYRALLREIGEACLAEEGIGVDAVVGLHWTDDAGIRETNRQTRGKDMATDVLSFPTVSYPPGKTAFDMPGRLRKEWLPEQRAVFLGDIVISMDRAKEQAGEYGHAVVRELCYLFVHGMLHLLGYDHENGQERQVMRDKEEKALRETGISRELDGDALLLELARKARGNAYVPYSKYAVGACLQAEDGTLFLGCNVENAAYGMCICGERTALVKAVSEGYRQFSTIAIAAEGAPPYPCGACRQMLYEFSPDMRVLVTWDGKTEETTLRELLPNGFRGDFLK